MANKLGSVKEVPISSGATVIAGMMVVNGDTNGVIVVQTTQTAAALCTALGIATSLKTVDLVARSGAFPDTGLPIFDV
jgi:regulator of RNase E activity RraA